MLPQDKANDATSVPVDFAALIAALRDLGAERFDAARLHYLETLLLRMRAHSAPVRRVLEATLGREIEALRQRFERARQEAEQLVVRSAQRYPDAEDALKRMLSAGDYKTLRRYISGLQAREHVASLSGLVGALEQLASQSEPARSASTGGYRSELKTVRESRRTWAKLSIEKQVAKALLQAPKNAGPINSHMLMLRSLELMRDLAPDYLYRFMSYADTLLFLDQCDQEKPAKKTAGADGGKKSGRRSGRPSQS